MSNDSLIPGKTHFWTRQANPCDHTETLDTIKGYLEQIAPCDVLPFMSQATRTVYHIIPNEPDHLALIYAELVADSKFLDAIDIDREDVGLANDHIRISVPR